MSKPERKYGKYPGTYSKVTKRNVAVHTALAERALGKRLPLDAQVHHASFGGLVICPNQAYHRLIHKREQAFLACGDATKRKCSYCKKYDDTKNMFLAVKASRVEGQYWHRECHNAHRRRRYARRGSR